MSVTERATKAPSETPFHCAQSKYLALAKLALTVVLTLTTWFSATAVMPQLKAHLHTTPAEVTWLAIAVQLGFMSGAIASAVASLSDILPPRTLMAAAAGSVAAVNLLLLVVDSAWQAIVVRLVTGILLAGIYPPALKFIATWFRKGRGIALGCTIGALTLGSAMPHAVNALGGVGWRGVIVATSAATFAGAMLIFFTLREGPFPFPKARFEPSQVGAALSDRRFLLCTTGYVGHMWELYALWSWLLFFVEARLEALGAPDPQWASALTFLVIAAGTPACIAAGAIADQIGRPVTTIVLMTLSGGCTLASGFAFTAPAWIFLTVGLLWGATVVADSAQFSAIVTEGGTKYVGTALTVQLGAGYAATVVAILILPSVTAWLGDWRWTFLALVPGPAIGCLAMGRLQLLDRALERSCPPS